ncbi:Gfo/Idh/MocA family protein [Mucilaginibacter ginkgonis]|uniref:Gfo/Idh/MocA family oxidoreductase n=1 Tax=Mucilaginibacter ginkgonis TaxID=2682091 RepID=A0A6I4HZ31_9SPHI|nr:Gfo/Idh/MocA family oxidoreductase [Mucilaginibacter ginkgonis]QQL48682.1 Gfo/Idh/MocA family oxidoreductase [Mucilaginibacter ginkgonis]
MDQINWGLIGCGNVTELKSGPAFNKVPNSQLKAVMRRDGEKAADYARRHGVEQWYDNAYKMMAEAGINSVYIATPPSSHVEYTLAGLERGLNVYVEKPVTRNAAEAQQIADAVAASGGKLTVAHYRRALPMFLYIKQLIDEQAIGEIRTVQIRMWKTAQAEQIQQTENNWRVQPEISGGGYFHDLAPHQLDLMLYYFGKPVKYQGYSLNQANQYPADDHTCGSIIFENNVVVNGSWSFNVAKNQITDSCEIIGTKGKVSFPFFGFTVALETDDINETKTFTHPQHIQQPMIEKIVNYFGSEGPNPCSIEEAVVLMKIMDPFTGK